MKTQLRSLACKAALCVLFGVPAFAQAGTLDIINGSGGPGGTAVVDLNYTTAGVLQSFTVNISYDPAVLTPQTDAAPNPNVNGCLANVVAPHVGPFTSCNNPSAGTIVMTVSDQFSGTVLPTTTPLGSITFDIAGGAAPGSNTPIGVTVQATTPPGNLTANPGQVDIVITGSAGYGSSPAPGASIDYGSAVVGSTTASQTLTISELGDMTLDVTAAAFSSGDIAFNPAFAAFMIVDGGPSVDLMSECTPTTRGATAGTLTVTNNSSNAPMAMYDTACDGLSPNVAVAPPSANIGANQGAPNPTATFTITNAQDGFTSDATNLTVVDDGGNADISLNPAFPTQTLAADGTAMFTAECDSNTAVLDTPFNETFTITWDDTVGPGTAQVTVTCTIASTAPEFDSTPAGGSTLAFGQIVNGTNSAAQNVAVSNLGDAQLDITACAISGADAAQFNATGCAPFNIGPAPSAAVNIGVTCDPTAVGVFSASLDLTTNDDDEGSVSYPLTCEGLPDAVISSDPISGSTITIGPLPPGASANDMISITNNGAVDDLTLDCTFMDNSGGVITIVSPADLGTAQQSIAPGATLDAVFACTPVSAAITDATLSCTTNDVNTTSVDYTIRCIGQPLVIPTLSSWGLAIMMMLMLLGAVVVTRRQRV